METRWEHQKYEQEIYQRWEKSGAFRPLQQAQGKTFTIIMPPPNANDPLHVGHAMFVTIEDILIRFHRMLGDETLWLPGTDHAGIETQYVFEKKLQKEGKSRFNFDRETLYQMIWDYVQENSTTAITQMKRLGASADWSRIKFTLNPEVINFVLTTFEKMHEEGLIYKDQRLVNYCTKCGTAYSDLELVYKEQTDPLYYIKYGPFTLATVRPETKFGDMALAVNPKDERYKKWVGKEVEAEGLLGPFTIKVVADEYVDPEFGTGVVKITPAHDPNDFEAGKRHGLETKQVIDFEGKLMDNTGPYAGLKVLAARKMVVEDLHKKGLIAKVDENYIHNVATCYRCGNLIEPLPRPQLFLKVKELTKKALEALDMKETKILGAGREKILRHWLENLKDWNISRQIVWGIRIPIWYNVEENQNIEIGFLDQKKKFIKGTYYELKKKYTLQEIVKGLQTLSAPLSTKYVLSRKTPGDNYLQETDTFDTWFSSGQWPVLTLRTGQPDDFMRYYPTSLMETGYDILPIWVMRMMIMGIYLTGKSPFKTVYLHGLVRDEKGQKMSKSKGNVINPLSLVEKYGADALRMALVMSTTAGHDSAIGEQKVKGMRNFSNKIWNAARFIKINLEESNIKFQDSTKDQSANIKEYNKHLNELKTTVTRQLQEYKIGLAAETVHNEFWHWFCDEVLEDVKQGKIGLSEAQKGMKEFLLLIHPFMPYVTEACWQELLPNKSMLINGEWPK